MVIESLYNKLVSLTKHSGEYLTPYLRRVIRFLALPYCYLYLVNWKECEASRLQVAKDLLYIFFKLKYFPDNYSLCRLWELERKYWKNYYGSIYDPYQRAKLRKEIQPKDLIVLFENKYICYKLCSAENFPLPMQFGYITPKDNIKDIFRNIFKKNPDIKLIIKPLYGNGGDGIMLSYMKNSDIFIKSKNIVCPIEKYSIAGSYVIQEYITQNQDLNKISKSTNTCRIVTLLTKENEVKVLGGYMRFGLEDSFIDNMCQGGVGVGINIEKGVLKKIAYDLDSRRHFIHRTSKLPFEGFEIPFWNNTLMLVKKIQRAFSYFKLLGHDIAITENGPVIIEINAEPDFVALEQTYGPILADEDILKEFKKYNLLINKMH